MSDKKLRLPNPLPINDIVNNFKNININQLTPLSSINGKHKLIKDCTYNEIEELIFSEDFVEIGESWLRLFGDVTNLIGNALMNMRNQRVEELTVTHLYVLSLIMLLAKQEQYYKGKVINNDLKSIIKNLEENLVVERTNAKNEAKKRGHYDLAVADKAYFNGQQEMLDKIKKLL